jgi:hypothetical protein
MEVMSLTVHLPDELADRLAAEAARRGAGVDETAAELLSAALEPPSSDTAAGPRRLAFAAIGASGSTRGAAQADELLAEGFGRD